MNGWFVAALGLAILAAVGVAEAEKRFKKAWLGFILAGVFAVDLCVFNSWNNPLAYGRISYDEMYGKGEKALREKVIPLMQAGMRLHAPERLAIFGSLNSPLQARVEATYGYNPLELAAYHDYRLAAEKNEKLLNGLSAMTIVVPKEENVKGNPDFLSRVFFALEVIDVASDADSRARLASLDPAKQALAATPHAPIRQDPAAEVLSLDLKDASMRVRCSAASPSLLTATNPLYPGWRVSVDGVPAEIVRVNHALMGVVVPGGSHDVFFEYVPRRFTLGAVLSALALLVALLGVFRAPAATESPAAQPDRPEAPPRRRRPR